MDTRLSLTALCQMAVPVAWRSGLTEGNWVVGRALAISQHSADGFVNQASCSWWDCQLTFASFSLQIQSLTQRSKVRGTPVKAILQKQLTNSSVG